MLFRIVIITIGYKIIPPVEENVDVFKMQRT